jgi:hypothetical protein
MRNRSSRVPARHAPAWPHTALAVIGWMAFGCSAPPGTELGDDDVPEYQGLPPGVSGGQASGQPATGATTAPVGAASSGASGSSSAGTPPAAPATSGGEQNSASGAPLTPSAPSAPSTNNAGANAGSPNDGAAGSSMVPPTNGNQGAGGANMGGNEPSTPPAEPPPAGQEPPPAQPPPVQPPPATPPPAAGPDIACPADATFCSGFESSTLPAGSIYQGNPGLTLDDSVSHSGDQSAVFEAVDGFNIREVVAPIPGQTFWVRLFIQTSTPFGDNDHDSLFVASTATVQQDNNAEHGPEFSEQGNQILINADDQLFSAAGPGFPSGNQGPTLSANTWHCVEAFYDGASGDVQFFADNQLLIDAPGFSRVTYQTFRFGYLQFPGHTPHVVRYDDVVVAANRVGCN